MGEGEGQKLVQYCNQWPAMLDFESMFDIGFQVLKYYFYVSLSFGGSIFSLAMSMLNYLTVCVRFVFSVCFTWLLISFRRACG